MRKIGQGAIYPPVGEYDYQRFMSNDPLCPNAADCGGYPIRIGAEAASGWVFRRWWGEPDIEETNLTIDSTQPHTMVAEFVYRPGLAAIDLVADLDYALDIWDESEIFWLLEDKNRLVRGENGAPDTFAPNGIPDVFEIALLQETLKNVNLDLSRRSGVVHQEVWDMWQANLAQIMADLPTGTDPRVTRVLAAYLCIGDRGSIAWVQHMAQTHHSTALDAADYEGLSAYFAFDEDADNDGTINQKEWFGTVDLLEPLENNLEIFLTYAIDPKLEGIPGAEGGKEAETTPDCGECVSKITITAEADPEEGGTAEIKEPKAEDKYPLGTKIKVHAEPYPDWRFVNWTCNDCMINGSRIPDETLLVTPVEGNTMGLVAHFEQNIIVVPAPPGTYNLGQPGATVTYAYSRDPEFQFDGSWAIRYDGEDPVTLTAHFSDHQLNWNNGRLNNPPAPGVPPFPEYTAPQAREVYEVITRWENNWGGGGSSTPEYAWGDKVAVLEGNWGADQFLIKKTDKIEINIEGNVGHVTLGLATGAVLAISPAMFPLTRDSGPEQSYNLDVGVGYAPPGYEFCCFTPALPPEPRSYADWMGVSAVFVKKDEVTLDISVEGCGWVTVSPAKKYYHTGEVVTLSGIPAIDCHVPCYNVLESANLNGEQFTTFSLTAAMHAGSNTATFNFKEQKPIVVIFGGEFTAPPPCTSCSGMHDWGASLPSEKYEVKMFGEYDVHTDGTGPAFDYVRAKVNSVIGTTYLAMAGHSHGGGSVFLLTKHINEQHDQFTGTFNIPLTIYADAIANTSLGNTAPMIARPYLSDFHLTVYETIDSFTPSDETFGSDLVNYDINTRACCSNVNHHSIVDCPVTRVIMNGYLENSFYCAPIDPDFCDDGITCIY